MHSPPCKKKIALAMRSKLAFFLFHIDDVQEESTQNLVNAMHERGSGPSIVEDTWNDRNI